MPVWMPVTISVTMLIPVHVSLKFAITQLSGISKLDRMLEDASEILYFKSYIQRESLTVTTPVSFMISQ